MGEINTREYPFKPSKVFATCQGFFVRAKVDSVKPHRDSDRWSIVSAMETDSRGYGYEVVFQARTADVTVGEEIDIPGHAIIAYSGGRGGWGPARVLTPDEHRAS